jgi:hypothetical protein
MPADPKAFPKVDDPLVLYNQLKALLMLKMASSNE